MQTHQGFHGPFQTQRNPTIVRVYIPPIVILKTSSYYALVPHELLHEYDRPTRHNGRLCIPTKLFFFVTALACYLAKCERDAKISHLRVPAGILEEGFAGCWLSKTATESCWSTTRGETSSRVRRCCRYRMAGETYQACDTSYHQD